MFSKVLILTIAIVLGVAVFIVGVYQLHWDGPLTRQVLRIVPLPVAVVNGRFITFAQFYESQDLYRALMAVKGYSTAAREVTGLQSGPFLDFLIENRIVADMAAKHDLQITGQESDRYFQYLSATFARGAASSDRSFGEKFGPGREQFKTEVVYPDLLRKKMQIAFLEEADNSSQYMRATAVRGELSSGGDFAEAAAAYSEDESSKYIGGEMGVFAREELPPWFADLVFSLNPGQISDVIAAPDGYHIMEVISKYDDAGVSRVQVRHILFRAQPFEDYLAKQKSDYAVYVLKKI